MNVRKERDLMAVFFLATTTNSDAIPLALQYYVEYIFV